MRFNTTKDTVEEKTRTTNHEGGEAFEPHSAEVALYKNVINNLLENSFYEDDEESFDGVKKAFDKCAEENPEFVLKLASYARQEENLRQVPQLLLVLAANDERTQKYVRGYAQSVMQRADEPLEVIAMQSSLFGKSIPQCLADSIEDALHNYNEYQYAKWDTDRREWKYRDLLNLVHPKPRDEEREKIFEKIIRGGLSDYDVDELKQEDTWESEMSKDDDRSDAEKYRDSLDSMGIFPRVRNARSMLESGVTAEEIYGDVTDEWIKNSRLFPFRFYQSYKAVRDCSDIQHSERVEALEFLEHAMSISLDNLPDTLDNTFTAVDVSGSMRTPVSGSSTLQCKEIATLFGALMIEAGSDVGVFASTFAEASPDPLNPLVTNATLLGRKNVGGSTNGHLVPKNLLNKGKKYDSVIIFTDMQLWNSNSWRNNDTLKDAWEEYKEYSPESSLYLVDLSSYGTLVTPEGHPDVYNISGWSDNVVKFIDRMERTDGIIREIEQVESDK